MRAPFDQIFALIDGKIIPLENITINNIVIVAGTVITPTSHLLGVEIETLIGCDMEVRREADITMIQGFYRDNMGPKLTD